MATELSISCLEVRWISACTRKYCCILAEETTLARVGIGPSGEGERDSETGESENGVSFRFKLTVTKLIKGKI